MLRLQHLHKPLAAWIVIKGWPGKLRISPHSSVASASHELDGMESEFLELNFFQPINQSQRDFDGQIKSCKLIKTTAHGFKLEISHCLERGLPQRMKVPSSALQT